MVSWQIEFLNFIDQIDVPGLDNRNYKGEELALAMYGILPLEETLEFSTKTTFYSNIHPLRDPESTEKLRQAHVVAFFVPQGTVEDTDFMKLLVKEYTEITVQHSM